MGIDFGRIPIKSFNKFMKERLMLLGNKTNKEYYYLKKCKLSKK